MASAKQEEEDTSVTALNPFQEGTAIKSTPLYKPCKSKSLLLPSNRNPDSEIKPWCFVKINKKKVTWKYCDIRQCEQSPSKPAVRPDPVPEPPKAPSEELPTDPPKGPATAAPSEMFATCGIAEPKAALSRIYGGIKAIPRAHPWQASIQTKHPNHMARHYCGGILIKSCWVLTAAHCVLHALFVYQGDISNQLLDAQVLLISQERCKDRNVYGSLLDNSMFCAGNLEGGPDSCQFELLDAIQDLTDTLSDILNEDSRKIHLYGDDYGGGDAAGITDASDWLYDYIDTEKGCEPNPCQNNGTCEPRGGTYRCACPEPYTGQNCQKVTNFCKSAKCGMGDCVITSTAPYYECKCRHPYQQPNCRKGKGMTASEIKVVLGGQDIEKQERYDQSFDVEDVIEHENYRKTEAALYNDIGHISNTLLDSKVLLISQKRCNNDKSYQNRLDKSMFCAGNLKGGPDSCQELNVQITSRVRLSELESYSNILSLLKGHISNTLLDSKVLLISQKRCNNDKSYQNRLDKSMFCAGNLKGGPDSCQGDSGGPLTCVNDGKHFIYGVVSWGDQCGLKNKPGIYARVTEFVDWIKSKIN
ncbi:UNVERIFIED_CONTAM: hypothetical protein FKN15_077530 [Acipenser sinensis]